MKLKKYFLTVDLDISGIIKGPFIIANYDLISLQNYTAFCQNQDELLSFMPDGKNFSARRFLLEHIDKSVDDPFAIRISDSKNSRKLKIIYKNDVDVLIANEDDLTKAIINNFSYSLEECSKGNIDKEKEEFLKTIYDKYASKNFSNTIGYIIDKKCNPDTYDYDGKYDFLIKKKWLFLALSEKSVRSLVKDVCKDDRKKIELGFLLKEKTGVLTKVNNYDSIFEAVKINLNRYPIGPYIIRNGITSNLEALEKDLELSYLNEDKSNEEIKNNMISEKVMELIEKIEELKRELECEQETLNKNEGLFLKDSDERINNSKEYIKKLKNKIFSLEYELDLLQSNRAFYTDAGFIEEKEKDM